MTETSKEVEEVKVKYREEGSEQLKHRVEQLEQVILLHL